MAKANYVILNVIGIIDGVYGSLKEARTDLLCDDMGVFKLVKVASMKKGKK